MNVRAVTVSPQFKALIRLRQEFAEWRLALGRPADGTRVISAQDGGPWSEIAYEQWRGGISRDTLTAAGVEYQRPYDQRHSFASPAPAQGPLGYLRREAARPRRGADDGHLRARH
jgi:hypothetical protein